MTTSTKTTHRLVNVRVEVLGHLNQITRRKELEVDLAEPTIEGLIDHLSKIYGDDFGRSVRDPSSGGFLVLVLVNGQDIDFLGRSRTQLNNGDKIVMAPLAAGG